MKITKVNIPKSPEANDGLDDIIMDRLESIVLLAGKNGSGKTRIIEKLHSTLKSKPQKTKIDQVRQLLENDYLSLEGNHSELLEIRRQLSIAANLDIERQLKSQIAMYEQTISRIDKNISEREPIQNWNLIETSELSDNYNTLKFVPKKLILSNSDSYTKNQLKDNASRKDLGMDYLPQSTFATIQYVQNRWFEATHQNSSINTDEKTKSIRDYNKLKENIQIFLNTTLDRSTDGDATLFGFPLGDAKLSDGQKILIQFCIALYNQQVSIHDFILFLDEPENHLHPAAIIETIDRIRDCIPNGQIWIATHSINLLAHFDPSSIWFVENGKVSHAGKIPEKVLESLVGSEEEIAHLRDFISLPAEYAISRYAFECLLPPDVVITNSTDPQSLQIRTALQKLANERPLRILDYGAGKGRTLSNIFDQDQTNGEDLTQRLDYIAFDEFDPDKEECQLVIEKVYGSFEDRYFTKMHDLLSKHDKKSFDVIIMCNVLHEIPHENWIKLFREGGELSQLLSDDGVLLLVEDCQLPKGEKAHKQGFLILDTVELKDLFNISTSDTDFIFSDQRGDGRLKAHLIPKNCLTRITADSKVNALKSLSDRAKKEVEHLRAESKPNYKTGNLHGFWIQQFANAELCLQELSSR